MSSRFLLQCQNNIMKAFAHVDQLIADKDYKTLEHDFLSCNDISQPNDTWLFVENLGNVLDGIVQYNTQASGFNIAYVCQCMTNSSLTPYQDLGYVIRVRIFWYSILAANFTNLHADEMLFCFLGGFQYSRHLDSREQMIVNYRLSDWTLFSITWLNLIPFYVEIAVQNPIRF